MDRSFVVLVFLCWISLEINNFFYQLVLENKNNEALLREGGHSTHVNFKTINNNNNDENEKMNYVKRNDGSFSACLLVMDENYRLSEWLSYHYHTYNLRYVIVGVDDRSKTSPSAIFEKFRTELGMTIIEWTDGRYMNGTKFEQPVDEHTKPGRVRKRYIYRQLFFMGKCLTHLHHAGQTWTALWDPDEYLVFRKGSSSSRLPAVVPSTFQRNVFRDFVEPEGNGSGNKQRCITIPRVLMGAEREEALSVQERADAESVVDDPQRLTTFRWHFHSNEKDNQINGLTKVMIDASSLGDLLPLTIRNPHRPLLEICGSPHFRDNEDSPLRLNHYLGSWEEYSYRDDARKGKERSKEAWLFRAKSCDRRDESGLEDWLGGFVQTTLGGDKHKARLLLGDAGLPSNYTLDDRNEAEWAVDRNSKVYKLSSKANFKQFAEEQKVEDGEIKE